MGESNAKHIVTTLTWAKTDSPSNRITPWVTNMGYQNAFIVAAFAALAQISVFLVFIKWGKNLRKASVPRYWKYIHQLQKEGLIH